MLRPVMLSRIAAKRAPLLLLLGLPCPARPAAADPRPTSLLEVDLKTGTRRAFDGGKPKTRADKALDALLDETTGESFSSKELKKVSAALRRFLRSNRSRALPRMILFLYPGRISRNALRELREVNVNVELVVDPCQRTVCREAVGRHLELLGRSLRQAQVRTSSYVIRFRQVTIRARTDSGAGETYRFSAAEVVQAGKQRGHGSRLVKRVLAELAGYEKNMARLIVRRLRGRRVRFSGNPRLDRTPGALSVMLTVRSDRVRYKSHVMGALMAAAEALGKSSITPAEVHLQVTALIPMRGIKRRVFSCGIHPLRLLLRNRLGRGELWATYIVERKKKGRHLSFADSETSGRGRQAQADDPQRVNELLAAHTSVLAPCLQAAARRRRGFSGVTLSFAVSRQGRATGLKITPASTPLRRCLERALARIRFSRHRGPPRRVTYPIHIKR